MSKILRRPMFRGGPVDSRGTGITSGLGYEAGGRVGYYRGGGPTYNPFKISQVPADQLGANILGRNTPNNLYDFTGKIDTIDLKEFLKPADITQQTDFKPRVTRTKKIEKPFEDDFEVSGEAAVVEDGKTGIDAIFEQGEEKARKRAENQESQLEQILSGNVEESTEAGIDDIKAQAELFKEILSADNEKKLRKARIGDASDYLLKFFEGTQKEGATVGSAAADVAGFATSRDSRTEKARAAIEKTDQTASALAINDYISGKKSKAEIAKMMKLAEYRSDLAAERGKKNVGEYIMSSKELGFSNKVKEGVQAKYGPRVFEEVTSEIMSDSTKFQPDESDVGKVYIETDTKTVYTFDKDGNRIPIYQG